MKQLARFPVLLIVLCFLLFSFPISGQDKVNKFNYGFAVSPELNVSRFKTTNVFSNRPSFGMTMGARVAVNFSKYFKITSGINFHSVTFQYRDYTPTFPGDIINGHADIYKSYYDINTTHTFIGLPVELKLNGLDESRSMFINFGGGIEQLLFSSGNVEVTESGVSGDFHEADYLHISTLHYYLMAGIGHDWRSPHNTISLMPMFQYSLSNYLPGIETKLANPNLLFFGIRFSYN